MITGTLDVLTDSNGEQYLEFPDEMMEELGWQVGDQIDFSPHANGFIMSKVETNKVRKVMVEMEDEQVDSIIVQELKYDLETFERDLEDRANGEGMAVFDSDPIKDVEYILEHIRAFRTVLEYYGVNSEGEL